MPDRRRRQSKDDYAKWVAGAEGAGAAGPRPEQGLDRRPRRARRRRSTRPLRRLPPADRKGMPPAFPALDGSKVVNGPKDAQIDTVLNGVERDGKPTAMVSWKQLSDVDLAAVATYTRNSWGNKSGEAVQPSEIKAARR